MKRDYGTFPRVKGPTANGCVYPERLEKSHDKMKECLGSGYNDYNLVVALGNGRPCEKKLIEKSFQRLIEENDLPMGVFHSLCHSSVTYKLKLNNGDLKATQGDTGHSQTSTLTEIYAHILRRRPKDKRTEIRTSVLRKTRPA